MLARLLAKSPSVAPALLVFFSQFVSSGLKAQGLGELTLESGLNEPLRASIELLETSGLEASQLLITMASPDDYENAGLERSSTVSQIEFAVELQPLGRGRIQLTTRDRVSEPYLILLVSARWPSGRVLRDYTVLLDLPTSAGAAPAAAVAAPAAGAVGAAQASADAAAGGSSYTVQAGDSLWEIAEQSRPSADVSVPQMMIAIQRANVAAFVNNNVNRLINGQVLRIPTREEIAIIEPAAAVAQINAQNSEVGLMPLSGTGSTAGAAAARDELSVLGGDDAAPAGGAGSSDLAATIAALEAELMLSEENLDRALIENAELTAQLGELEEQIAILQNIIAIEDERIAQLQNELASQAAATDQALAEAGRAADVLAASSQNPSSQGFVGQVLSLLQNNLIFIGAALAVVLAALGVLVMRARSAAAEAEVDFTAGVDLPVADVEQEEEEAEEGFLARLLARFRRRYEDDDDDFVADEIDDEGEDAPVLTETRSAKPADIEVDEIPDELTSGLFDDEDEVVPAVALASSVLDEVDAEAPATAAAQSAEEASEEIDIDSALDAVEDELEFDLTEAPAEEPEVAALAGAAAVEPAPEVFEFKVDAPAAAPAAEPAPVQEPEIESFAFKLDPAPQPEPAAAPEPEDEPEVETFEFKPAAAAEGLDLGSLSFDENDAKAADEPESAYTPRSNMDECDTKLDLAVAYEAMGDIDGAIEILDEVIAEGKPAQIEEAQRLKAKWQDA